MILLDVNVLIYAFDRNSVRHEDYHRWLENLLANDEPFGVSDLVLSAVIRIATHPKIFVRPGSPQEALKFVSTIRNQLHCTIVTPGTRHWEIFTRLCEKVGAKGNLVTDAYFAALAIESGSEWITTDRDYSRFPGLRWRLPFNDIK